MKKVQVSLKKQMPVYKVDAVKNDRVVDQLKINGFPEIFCVDKNHRLHKYNGPHKATEIMKFVMQYK
jgi:thioredoxin-like negative regulator of GroEL